MKFVSDTKCCSAIHFWNHGVNIMLHSMARMWSSKLTMGIFPISSHTTGTCTPVKLLLEYYTNGCYWKYWLIVILPPLLTVLSKKISAFNSHRTFWLLDQHKLMHEITSKKRLEVTVINGQLLHWLEACWKSIYICGSTEGTTVILPDFCMLKTLSNMIAIVLLILFAKYAHSKALMFIFS